MSLGGVGGPIRLEDANDLADLAEARRAVFPRAKWVDEDRANAEAAELNAVF